MSPPEKKSSYQSGTRTQKDESIVLPRQELRPYGHLLSLAAFHIISDRILPVKHKLGQLQFDGGDLAKDFAPKFVVKTQEYVVLP